MVKKIGITCDTYKAERFRQRLNDEGFTFGYDGAATRSVHFFKIHIDEAEYIEKAKRLAIVLQELELEFKQSN